MLRVLQKLALTRDPKTTTTCDLTIDGKKQTVMVSKTAEGIVTVPLNGTGVVVDWTCSQATLVDTSVSFLPKDLTQTLGAASHVSKMNRSISDPDAKIGEKVKIV